jgi:trehalose-6-phosphate synthase
MAIRINSQLNALDVEGPLQFISQSLPVEEVVALYCMADALVITPLRDGMNVRPFEYVVCRHALGMHAAVVLSEFAGCARSLGGRSCRHFSESNVTVRAGALLVNPWDTNEVKETILQALQLDFQERMRAHDNMVQYVHNFTSLLWQNTFIEQLRECAGEAQVWRVHRRRCC